MSNVCFLGSVHYFCSCTVEENHVNLKYLSLIDDNVLIQSIDGLSHLRSPGNAGRGLVFGGSV